jgi:endonuclease YncB( thermonuclease family)
VKRSVLGAACALVAAACTGIVEPTALDTGDSVAVVRVLDGDSLVTRSNGSDSEVRLLGINAPERDECYAGQARSRTIDLAADRVLLSGTDRDRFGRLLAYAYTSDGMLINQQLIAEGLALALTTDHPRLAEFKAAEEAAFRERLGRWQADACGPATAAGARIGGLQYDAPGDDGQNPNGEWVEITNGRGTVADLTGWTLQDESSSHRFEFPAGFRLGPSEGVRIFSGCGEPAGDRLFWCDEDPVWNNGGDTAYLLDPVGNVVDRYAF